MKYVTTFKGKDDPEGWIVLDLKGADIEGATKVYLSMVEIQNLKQRGNRAEEKLQEARSLFGSLGSGTVEDEE